MTSEPGGDPPIQRNYYKESLFGGHQTEEEYTAEREQFAECMFSECGVEREGARDLYDTRKMLSSLEVTYAGGKMLTRDDFLLALTLGKKLLRHEDREGVIPFLVRTRKKHPELSAIQHHPRFSLIEIILQRFLDTEEMTRHEDIGSPEDGAQDVRAAIDFCLVVHHWNTEYYRRFPSVGTLFVADAPDQKKDRVLDQANYLAWWRGLPYELSQALVEFRLLDHLDERTRSRYLEELSAMSLEELFDESYFQHRKRAPAVPHMRERPPRKQPADQLLRMLVGEYGSEQGMQEIKDNALANTYSLMHFNNLQLERLRELFDPAEE